MLSKYPKEGLEIYNFPGYKRLKLNNDEYKIIQNESINFNLNHNKNIFNFLVLIDQKEYKIEPYIIIPNIEFINKNKELRKRIIFYMIK